MNIGSILAIIVCAIVLALLYVIAIISIKRIYSDMGEVGKKTSSMYLSIYGSDNNDEKITISCDGKIVKKILPNYKGLLRLPSGEHELVISHGEKRIKHTCHIKNGLDIVVDFNEKKMDIKDNSQKFVENGNKSFVWIIVIVVFVALATYALIGRLMNIIT